MPAWLLLRLFLLPQLTMDGWLAHAAGQARAYTLGPRAFLELGDYILKLDLPEATAREREGLA